MRCVLSTCPVQSGLTTRPGKLLLPTWSVPHAIRLHMGLQSNLRLFTVTKEMAALHDQAPSQV